MNCNVRRGLVIKERKRNKIERKKKESLFQLSFFFMDMVGE